MRALTLPAQHLACAFIESQARPLEQARYAFHFLSGSREAVLTALAAFQNPDGGFGHALEPDFRLPDSSALATTTALQILGDLEVGPDHPLVQGAMRYLVNTVDLDCLAWAIIPPNANDAPHAPWWVYNPDLSHYLNNPRPEIVGYFFQYAGLVPTDLRERLIESAITHLENLTDDMPPSFYDNVLCYVRLAATATLPDVWRGRLFRRLAPLVDHMVAKDPATWGGYVMKPLKLASHPAGLFAAVYADLVNLNLDYEIEHQGEDGAWLPNWTWSGMFPEVWPVAEREWKGVLTLNMLKTLRAFGRWK